MKTCSRGPQVGTRQGWGTVKFGRARGKLDYVGWPGGSAGMMAVMYLLQTPQSEVSVDLRSGNIGVSQQRLHAAQVGAILHHVRGAPVPHHVRSRPGPRQ